jgi:dethiobiotin synthetase
MRGLFVTGTDTGVGKTILSAALLAAMSAAGEPVHAHKPVVTGLDEPPHEKWPPDHELLAAAAGMTPEEVSPLRYGPAVSPHLAARLAGEEINPADLLARARRAGEGEGSLIVEGVGGLLTPLADNYAVRDLAVALGLPVVITARSGLGTINHTLLTLEAARAVGLNVRAVVLTPWPAEPSVLERSNRETIARLGDVEVAGMGHVPSPAMADLARVGDTLLWRRWCPPENFVPSQP